MNTIMYHAATADDLELMINYRIEFLNQLTGIHPAEKNKELKAHLKKYFSKALADKAYLCYYAKSGTAIAGIGGLIIRELPGHFKNPSGLTGYIVNMYTVPAFRRQGVCSSILKHLQAAAQEKNIHAFELLATKEGEPVYIRQGFILHHEPLLRKYI